MSSVQVRGERRASLVKELASGQRSHSQLADEYGMATSSVSAFATRNRDEIQKVVDGVVIEKLDCWIADKQKRIAEYAAMYESLTPMVRGMDPNPKYIRIRMDCLQRVAEELGQLPTKTRVEIEQNTFGIQILGMNGEGE